MSGEIVPATEKKLLCLSTACRALADAKKVDEVMDIRDRAQALHHYLRQRGDSSQAMLDAAELKLRAERRIGELLAEMPKNPGGRSTTDTMSAVGVAHHESSRWQKLARIDEPQWEEHIALGRQCGELTTAGALRLAKQLQQTPEQAERYGQGCTVDDLHHLVAAGKRYGTIYADPPWQYDNQGAAASAENHYQTMTVDEIAALPVRELAADRAHLHLWTTNAFLFDCQRIMKSWGFEYKSLFVWCKPQMGTGNYWRVSHELLLLGVRGKCGFLAHDIVSWKQYDRGRHSAKPEQVRHLIEKASPGPRLELFGRQMADGWTVWGNEIECDLFHHQAVVA
jgi:N6-adenosine-specific RNA methylase IME4